MSDCKFLLYVSNNQVNNNQDMFQLQFTLNSIAEWCKIDGLELK